MFSHVMVGSDDLAQSKIFYDAIMQVIGYNAGVYDPKGRCMYISENGVLGVTKPINGEPTSVGNGMTVGFKVASPELVDQWHAAGVANGGMAIENPPGIRGEGNNQKYVAYLRDPFGNKLCAVYFVK
ncbi:VOC family protein [Vibrio nitrifigilis]|uniref:VOC family protein n=1 Tax=Vibrio nitrifigilis TaxID=2789781 RepID=A0ABS0GCG1_9VIBR|nr:VOC family protein [Vibrio nitrifigilis]MBF9000101.1 VOC family protein [Vibrio nitrifigilis]